MFILYFGKILARIALPFILSFGKYVEFSFPFTFPRFGKNGAYPKQVAHTSVGSTDLPIGMGLLIDDIRMVLARNVWMDVAGDAHCTPTGGAVSIAFHLHPVSLFSMSPI